MATYAKYQQIEMELEMRIASGEFAPGEKLPSEHVLCKTYATSRITVRRALEELKGKGLIYSMHGSGYFVRDPSSAVIPRKVLLVLPYYPEIFSAGLVPDVIKGVERELSRQGYTLLTIMGPRNASDTSFFDSLQQQRPDGIIYTFYCNEMVLDDLKNMQVPVVFLDSEPKDNPFDHVTGDDYNSAYEAVTLLLKSGLERVGFYSPWSVDFSTCNARCAGTRQALIDAGLYTRESWFHVAKGNMDYHSSVILVDMVSDIKDYLMRNPALQGMVVMNDSAAFAAIKAAMELGKEVPGDLKIISYGNFEWCKQYLGGITSHEQNFLQYGEEAARLLIGRIEGTLPAERQQRVISYNLCRRNSF